MTVTVRKIGNGNDAATVHQRDWTAFSGPIRPDLPRIDWALVSDNGATMTVRISDADADRPDVQAAIARAAQ